MLGTNRRRQLLDLDRNKIEVDHVKSGSKNVNTARSVGIETPHGNAPDNLQRRTKVLWVVEKIVRVLGKHFKLLLGNESQLVPVINTGSTKNGMDVNVQTAAIDHEKPAKATKIGISAGQTVVRHSSTQHCNDSGNLEGVAKRHKRGVILTQKSCSRRHEKH